jgi:hypothetical protein
MIAPLLLAAALVGPPAPCSEKALVHGLIVGTARVSGGAFVDLWSTEYALARCEGCREGNPLGLSRPARTVLKGAVVVGSVAAMHKLRRDGHPGWAKWLGRGLLAIQVGAAVNNVRRAK